MVSSFFCARKVWSPSSINMIRIFLCPVFSWSSREMLFRKAEEKVFRRDRPCPFDFDKPFLNFMRTLWYCVSYLCKAICHMLQSISSTHFNFIFVTSFLFFFLLKFLFRHWKLCKLATRKLSALALHHSQRELWESSARIVLFLKPFKDRVHNAL